MTYGWAILVVLAAIAAMAYSGVFSIDNWNKEQKYCESIGYDGWEYYADSTHCGEEYSCRTFVCFKKVRDEVAYIHQGRCITLSQHLPNKTYDCLSK